MHQDAQRDPYAPPPRHRDHSGAVVRVVLLAALLGLTAWGAMEFMDGPSLVAESQPTLADTESDAGYEAIPETQVPDAAPAPETSTQTAPPA